MGPSPFGPGNPERPGLAYVFLRFLRYGMLAWGGPVAQIGLMHQELVERDRWITEERFRKTLALYQALPGPEATELAVFFGHIKRGRMGGFLAGLGFILPGLLLVFAAGVLYTTVLTTRQEWDPFLYGARPAVLALMVVGLVRLTRATVKTPTLAFVATAAAIVGLLRPGITFVATLLAAGIVALAVETALQRPRRRSDAGAVEAASFVVSPAYLWLFLKCGLLTFGGAYTIIPVLHAGAVVENGWISDGQLLDAMAITGVLPTPFVTVGSFVGHLVAGPVGMLVATVLVFAPAFAFTLVGHHALERLVHEPRLHGFLLGVTAGVIGLLAAALVPLGRAGLPDPVAAAIAVAAFGLLQFVKRVPRPAVMLGAVALGWGLVETGLV